MTPQRSVDGPAGEAPPHDRVEDRVGEAAIVLTVVDDREVAQDLAGSAVDRGLAACVQIDAPVDSVYRWEGAVRSDREWRVVAKTTASGADRLVEHWATEHTYEVPEILVVPVTGGHEPYLRWIVSEVRSDPR